MANVLKINVFFQHIRCHKSMEMKKKMNQILIQIYCQLYGVCTFCTTSWSVYYIGMYMFEVFLTSYRLKKLFKSIQWARFTLGIQSLNMKMVWNISSMLGFFRCVDLASSQ